MTGLPLYPHGVRIGAPAYMPCYGENGEAGGEYGPVTKIWLWDEPEVGDPVYMIQVNGDHSGAAEGVYVSGDVLVDAGGGTWRLAGFKDLEFRPGFETEVVAGTAQLSGPLPCRGLREVPLSGLRGVYTPRRSAR